MPRPARQRNPLKWLLVRMRSGSTWRQFCYHLLSLPIAVASFGVVVGIWCGALISLASAAAVQARGETELAVALAVLGTALLAAGPWPARWLASLDVLAARALLGPSRAEELAQRVESLRESRAEVVDAADAERRRIERDLHDGAQQRLVSLAMNLGMARAGLKDLPEPAREVIAQAHEEAKQALKELRDLVRGLHPAVLSEEGLDAALSGLAARAPCPYA
ncbi:sensor histidine kinase [Thermocatellispora tengchongensis]|uniref:sensor histidine kinase n=1 Tax=Thermocatellispora tengchongensis TaxID=1073253 RepID=UPI003625A737